MMTAKQAAEEAANYYKEVTGDYNQVSIAEVELSDNKEIWHITLAHKVATSPFGGLDDKWGYKSFTINADTGEVTAMKIKKI